MAEMLQKISGMSGAVSPLVKLILPSSGSLSEPDIRRIGFTLSMDYTQAVVMANDGWRQPVSGIPMNSYLLAAPFNPNSFTKAHAIDQRVVLLRVLDKEKILTDDEHARAITQYFQENPDDPTGGLENIEALSRAQMQWSGIRCRILGTFFVDPNDTSMTLQLGTDIEDIFAAKQMRVFKPSSAALEQIVNFVDPRRKAKAEAEAKTAGVGTPKSFEIGHVRYTSTRHLQMHDAEEKVPVRISPVDFLARRTAVFGMTRTGKSNTTKTMVSQVALTAFETHQPIGQLIFDINGEYANANQQDGESSINVVFDDNTVRYRAMDTPGFRDLRSNFYKDVVVAIEQIANGFAEKGLAGSSDDLKTFLNLDLTPPDESNHGARTKWLRRVSMFKCILFNAGYPPDTATENSIEIPIGEDALSHIFEIEKASGSRFSEVDATNKKDRAQAVRKEFELQSASKAGVYSASAEGAVEFWKFVRAIEWEAEGFKIDTKGIKTKSGKQPWLESMDRALLSILVGRSSKSDSPIVAANGIRTAAIEFHGIHGSDDLARDIYNLLRKGRIVILDLSVGSPLVREGLAKRLAASIFHKSAGTFNQGHRPPRIVIYVEEAHNLIGKKAELTETWPRLAKEGAKYGIALVYATQEPSSVHPNILSNTENFFVTHLNNDNEIRALSGYYDFADFADSLKRSQDVGFARIKVLSANFVTPTQIKEFQPADLKQSYIQAKKLDDNEWFKPLQGGS